MTDISNLDILQHIGQSGLGAIIAAIISAAVSFNILFLKWLIKTFSDLRKSIKDLTTEIHKLAMESRNFLDEHEEKDQVRHEENLKRFETISVSLAKIEK